MQSASLSELKKELQFMPQAEMLEAITRLIKYKKENKELLQYLLFDSRDETTYIQNLKAEMDEMFSEVNTKSMHWAKKSIRKILRITTKYAKYSGIPTTHIELLIHFCEQMKALPLPLEESLSMQNLYTNQLTKINKLLLTLHEDLQYDYQERIEYVKLDLKPS